MNLSPFLKFISRLRSPRISGNLKLPGIHSQIEIRRDRWGIPHIYAADVHDLLFAQGFAHAQDRLWQMDYNRRVVAGRLAEILGPVALPVDRWMRTLTMRRVAEFEAGLLNEETRSLIQSYINVVNAFIQRGPLPLEFVLLRYKPEPWEIADSLSWVKMMAWTLSVNWEAELLRARLIQAVGPEVAAELEPGQLERWYYTVPAGSDYSHIGEAALEPARQARPFSGPSPYQGLGSNNWVIAGSRTTTGRPLLANDMHLTMSIPAIWYENHLSCCDIDATGVSFPGIPFIISGHNGHVAWGYTNGFPDVQDLYMERLRRDKNGAWQAEYNGSWEAVQVLSELIHIKGQPDVVEEVLITRHGPVINSLASELAGEQPLALRWTGLEPNRMTEALVAMWRARSCQEFHLALRKWAVPTQNVVYADTDGNIAYTFPGLIPVRARGNGKVPVPGWTDEYEWIGYVPYDALPHLYNPPQGFIATANNRTVAPDYPIHLDLEPVSGDRQQRITELIHAVDKIDIPYIQQMQFDQCSPSSRQIADHLRKLAYEGKTVLPQLQTVLDHICTWDGTLSPDGPAPAIYQVFVARLISLMVSKHLDGSAMPHGGDLTERFLGKGPNPVLAESGWFSENWLPWLIKQLEDPEKSRWFDLGHSETYQETMRQAILAALEELEIMLGPQIENWSWGKIHSLKFKHVLGNNPALAIFYNRGPFPLGGDSSTIWATGSGFHTINNEFVIGPPYRMIVDLGNLDNSVSLLSPGQSGSPASQHYDDQSAAWFTGQYHPMLYQRSGVEANTLRLLRITPI